MSGGYDEGYRACPCFWGTEPGTLVTQLLSMDDVDGKHVLDVGCGEGKNAARLASAGAIVRAIDISDAALVNARKACPETPNLRYEHADALHVSIPPESTDVVVAYGLLHCLKSLEEVSELVTRLKAATRHGGYNLICTFNDRSQDLRAHPELNPVLLAHDDLIDFYRDWNIVHATDTDLRETHPHNGIEHVHSMTRIIARKERS